jgi:hypothetical protein
MIGQADLYRANLNPQRKNAKVAICPAQALTACQLKPRTMKRAHDCAPANASARKQRCLMGAPIIDGKHAILCPANQNMPTPNF